MADTRHEGDAPPPVPSFWRLGWLLIMQPLTLHRMFVAWGLEDDPSLWKLRGRLRERDPVVLALMVRLSGWLVLVMPVSTVPVAGSFELAGLPVRWEGVAFSCIVGTLIGITLVIFGGTFLGFTGGIAGAIGGVFVILVMGGTDANIVGFALGAATGIGYGGALAGPLITVTGIPKNIAEAFVGGIVISVAVGAIAGIMASAISVSFGFSVAAGVATAVVFPLAIFHLPLYPAELILAAALRLAARLRPTSLPHLASYLPYRHHELICLPLPFLTSFLVRLGEEHPAEGRRALSEAAASLGQKGPARRALVELQARALERVARARRYASAASLALPFLRERESLGEKDQPAYLAIVDSISAAAKDLEAARSTGSHHQRRQALTRARKELDRTLDRLIGIRRLTREERRWLPVVKEWLDRVADEEAALASLERESPQVPLVFVPGVPLTPADDSLFVGRRNLVRLLDQDLAAERPVPLVLLGQRRMGKSTLLNFLPRLLGTGTRVVRLDFQGLSGNSLRGEPHRWVAAEVSAALVEEEIEAIQPPEETPWGATLDWLSALEEPLTTSDRRLLIALDEVEGLERGIREKWSDPAFLDFLRAAGDRLRRIRFLLVTAHPFSRLGPHWSDRLISAQTRRIEPLAEEEARGLLTQPVPGFPDIYPPGGVERLLTETACHPYLLQLTAYHLTRRLNDAGRLKATDEDVTAALDQALEENNLFQYLWYDLTAAEQRLVAALARGEEPAGEAAETLSQARRRLAGEQLIQRGGDGEGWRVAVPLFARWVREIGAAG